MIFNSVRMATFVTRAAQVIQSILYPHYIFKISTVFLSLSRTVQTSRVLKNMDVFIIKRSTKGPVCGKF